jgi:hypothetical protein
MGVPQCQDVRQCTCGVLLARDNVDGRCTTCRVRSRDRLAGAPEVPPGFWGDDAMQAAIHERHMGRVIRAFRLHPAHGRHPISQQTAAQWAGLTQAQLSRIETHGPVIQIDRLIQWARILRIPSPFLWFTVPAEGGDGMRRAEFLRLGGGVVAGGAVAALLGGASVTTVTEDDCAQVLAWELWRRRATSLHGDELPAPVAAFLAMVTMRPGVILRSANECYSFAHRSFVDFYIAQRIFAEIGRGDSALFAEAQTTHDTDLVIREFVLRDANSAESLSHWMRRAPSPVLRVNAAGVLAKLGQPATADVVVTALKADPDVRHLYVTAVASRVLSLPWDGAGRLAAEVQRGAGALALSPEQSIHYAAKLAEEVSNPRDAAARWCAVVMLAQLGQVAPAVSTTALQAALREERGAETLRSIGAALSGTNPITL